MGSDDCLEDSDGRRRLPLQSVSDMIGVTGSAVLEQQLPPLRVSDLKVRALSDTPARLLPLLHLHLVGGDQLN